MAAIRESTSWNDYNKRTEAFAKLWGITPDNRRKYINDCGVFIRRTKEAISFGSCKVGIEVAEAPGGKYAVAYSHHVGNGGFSFAASVCNEEIYDDPHSAKLGAMATLSQRISRAAVLADGKAHKADALKMLAYLNAEQEPLLL